MSFDFEKFQQDVAKLVKVNTSITTDSAGTVFDGPDGMDPAGTIFEKPKLKRQEFRCELCSSTVQSFVAPGSQCPFCNRGTAWHSVPKATEVRIHRQFGFNPPETE